VARPDATCSRRFTSAPKCGTAAANLCRARRVLRAEKSTACDAMVCVE
jgi:hypothetical protein